MLRLVLAILAGAAIVGAAPARNPTQNEQTQTPPREREMGSVDVDTGHLNNNNRFDGGYLPPSPSPPAHGSSSSSDHSRPDTTASSSTAQSSQDRRRRRPSSSSSSSPSSSRSHTASSPTVDRAAFIQQLVAVGEKYSDILGTDTRIRERAWEAGITNVYRDLSYSVPVQIGTPPQTLNVTIDTGSTTLWVYASCNDAHHACDTIATFNTSASASYATSDRPFVQNYGVGRVAGTLGNDVVTIAGNAVPGQQFGMVSYDSEDGVSALKGSTKAGLLGLGWPAKGIGQDARSWWATSTLVSQWEQPMFGIHLARELDHNRKEFEVRGGRLTLGGVDTTLYTGEINFIPATRDSTVYWQVPLEGVSVNGVAIDTTKQDGSAPLAIVDTGTTVALGAHDAVADVYAAIPGAAVDDSVTFSMLGFNAQVYTFPCTSISGLPRLSLTMGGQAYPIYPPDLVVAINGTTCTGALLGLASNKNIWLLGDTFLKNVYSVYRYDPPAVGFAPVATAHDARYAGDDIGALAGQNIIYFDSSSERSGSDGVHFTSGVRARVAPGVLAAAVVVGVVGVGVGVGVGV